MKYMTYRDYFRPNALPTPWCPGCGGGQVLQGIVHAFETLQIDPSKTAVISGIGCFGKADSHLCTNGIHTAHGRALAYATGLKLTNPELNVICVVGDGDGVTIGGNHFIHTARRNIDITVVMCNNFNYGMTGGQYSGTTPSGAITATSRYGHIERPFDICKLAETCGATYVARSTSEDVLRTARYVAAGIRHRGFSFIEVAAPCPIQYGKNNGMRTAPELLKWIKSQAVSKEKFEMLSEAEKVGKIAIGEFVNDSEIPDYGTLNARIQEKAGKLTENIHDDESIADARKLGKKWEIMMTGVGGQGSVLSATMLGDAASREGHQCTVATLYGGEVRGTYAKADIIIADEPIDFIDVEVPNLVVAMSHISYDRHVDNMTEGSILIYNSSQIKERPGKAAQIGIPLDDIALRSGTLAAVNMAAVGKLIQVTKIVEPETFLEVMRERFSGKPTVLEMNIKAFREGLTS